MSCLESLDNDRISCYEQVFPSEQEQPTGEAAELLVVKRIVVRLPIDLGDIEIGRDAFGRTELLQFGSFYRDLFQALANPSNPVRILTEPLRICQQF